MEAIEAVISDAASLSMQQDDGSERPLTDSSEDEADGLADEGADFLLLLSLHVCTLLIGMQCNC